MVRDRVSPKNHRWISAIFIWRPAHIQLAFHVCISNLSRLCDGPGKGTDIMVDAAFPPDAAIDMLMAAHIKIFERAASLRCVEGAIIKARIRLMVGARVLAGARV
eukprot:CAMPEP_0185769642 /NCGR_PEP_ID=MMETSP1174-20130828/55144_1 /TAXON_ID=35687 /ORGANISM="Dictyocha speculum, Strain CCMP1381" /LENGTH=104 /DNA_ID=CAMNT_0028454789 /DNA_START=248 /DNA_END=558 /DNA_ORIENTATION=-